MEFKELNNIAKSNKLTFSTSLPQDSFELARSFNLRIKNSTECKQDFPDKNPLSSNNAIYALFKGEYTIYYDEKYAYKNFAIAHEIAHHLLRHESDGAVQHHDSNLLAAMLVAPNDLIMSQKIKSAKELSLNCSIPIGVAEEYWKHICPKLHLHNIYYIISAVTLSFVLVAGCIIFQNTTDKDVERTETLNVNNNNIQDLNFVITTSGTKYHKADCSLNYNLNKRASRICLPMHEPWV